MDKIESDLILRIQHPVLSENPPGNRTRITAFEAPDQSLWQVTLDRDDDFLAAKIERFDCLLRDLEFIHLVPTNGGMIITCEVFSREVKGHKHNLAFVRLHASCVLMDSRYDFFLVQTKTSQVPWYMLPPPGETRPWFLYHSISSDGSKPLDPTMVTNQDTMSGFLCDVYSVDTQFVFKVPNKASSTRLWAHRSVLVKYPAFDDLLKQASKASPSAMGPLTVPVTRVSLAAFAALLKFLYCGQVERLNYPGDFAISERPSFRSGHVKDAHRWHPLDLGTPLSAETVTWHELLDAAEVYRVDALRAHCEGAIKAEARAGKTNVYKVDAFRVHREAAITAEVGIGNCSADTKYSASLVCLSGASTHMSEVDDPDAGSFNDNSD
ncbi:hypothetical protein BGZ74_006464 [Mortierella antarctica]|nr:hypothetical protein BGZ74_006464 [Mortierella antarctica]